MRSRGFFLLSGCALLLAYGCGEKGASAPSPAVRVPEAGYSFGFCLGPCNGVLEIDGEALTHVVANREGDQVLASNEGSLTSGGAARLAALAAELPEELQDTYGCPDCADAGAAYVVVNRPDAAPMRVDYEYPNPPAELAALDAFLKSVMNALGTCQATSDVVLESTCSPVPR